MMEVLPVVAIAALVGAFVLGVMCGWFACAHSGELVNLTEEEYLKVIHEIYLGHGTDAGLRDELIAELNTFRKDVYADAADLSGELKKMIGRAAL
jgi:hypothetical protein